MVDSAVGASVLCMPYYVFMVKMKYYNIFDILSTGNLLSHFVIFDRLILAYICTLFGLLNEY